MPLTEEATEIIAMDIPTLSIAATSSTEGTSSDNATSSDQSATGSFEGHSVTTDPPKPPRYRLDRDGWKEQNPTTGEWHPSDRFQNPTVPENVTRKIQALNVVIEHYNRANDIAKKRDAYQQELKEEAQRSSSSDSENRTFTLSHLIAVLEKASSYQNAMLKKLYNHEPSTKPNIAMLQESHRLKNAIEINEFPNKIEAISDQIEQDYFLLDKIQIQLNALQQYQDKLTANGRNIPPALSKARKALDQAKAHQKELIKARSAYAQSLLPPFQEIDQPTQTRIDEHLSSCTREREFVRKKMQSIGAMLYDDQRLAQQLYIQYTARLNDQASREAQRPQPRQQIIDLLTRSAELFKQAAQENNPEKAEALSDAALAFRDATQEAQRPQPRQQVIDLFTRSAEISIQVAQENSSKKIATLNTVALTFSRIVQEMQKYRPNQGVIDLYTRSAECYQQAAQATGLKKAEFLNAAGFDFSNAAKEAQRPQPRQQVIDLYTRSAECYQQAAQENDPRKAKSLSDAGSSLFSEAQRS